MITKDIDVLILCGGKGTRLKDIVRDRPKALAPVKKKIFLDILIKYVASFGFRRFILCTGHMSDCIKNHCKGNNKFEIIFSEEKTPLGTGGAVKNAERLIKSQDFLIINGDCLINTNLKKFLKFHKKKDALVSIIVSVSKNKGNEYGNVLIRPKTSRIAAFKEKIKGSGKGFISAGFYIFNRKIFSSMPQRKEFSLEYDFFPRLTDKKFYGYTCKDDFIDIGTPKRYRNAQLSFLNKI